MTPTDIAIYYATWLFPSSTFCYILFHEKYKIGKIKSYVMACIIAATLMFPIEKYIFNN